MDYTRENGGYLFYKILHGLGGSPHYSSAPIQCPHFAVRATYPMPSRLRPLARIARATLLAAAFLAVASPELSAETLSFDGIQVTEAATKVIFATDYADYQGGNGWFDGANGGGRLYWRGAAGDGQYMHFNLSSLAGQRIVGPGYLTLQAASAYWGGGVGGSNVGTANAAWTAAGGVAVPGATALTSAANATGSYVSGSSVSWGLGGSVLQGLVDNPSTNLGLAVIGGSGSTLHFDGGMNPYLTLRTGTLSAANVAGVITVTGGDPWNAANYTFTAGDAYARGATLTINGSLSAGSAGDIVINGGQVVVNQPGGVDNAYWTVNSTRINTGGLLTINGHSHVKNLTLAGGELGASAINGQWGGWSIDGVLQATGATVSTMSAPRVSMDNTTAVQVDAGSTLNFTGTIGLGTVTKTGNGILTLAAANAHGGGVVLNAGTLSLKNDAALGTGALSMNGGKLVLNGLAGLHEGSLTVSSLDAAQANPRTATRLTTTMANTNAGWSDNQQWNYSGYVYVPTVSRWTFGECIDDAAWLKVDDTVVLNDSTWWNVSLGSIDLSAGWHRIDARFMNGAGGAGYAGGWGTGFGFGVDRQGRGDAAAANFTTLSDAGDGATLVRDLLISNNLVLAAGVNELQTPTGGAILSGILSGSGQLLKTGSGWLTLTGANTYSGGTHLTEGVIVAGSAGALGTGDVTFTGGVLRFTANSTGVAWAERIKNSPAPVTLDSAGLNLSVNGLVASNTGGLTKSGQGTLSLVGASSYGGETRVNTGTLKLVTTLGAATVATSTGAVFIAATGNRLAGLVPSSNVGGGAAEGSGLVGSLTDGVALVGAATAYTVNSSQVITFNLPTAAAPLGYDLLGVKIYATWNDPGRDAISLEALKVATVTDPTTFVTLAGSAVNFDPGSGFNGLNLASIMAANGVLAKDVAAVQFVFGAQENGHAGYAELELLATAITGTGGRDLLPVTSRLIVEAGATLDLNGNHQTIAALAGAGTVTNAALGGTVTLTVNQDATTTFTGALTGDLRLVKSGNGILTLSGSSTYTAGTTVQAGTLVLEGYNGYAPIRGTLTVNAGATAVTTGDGTGLGWQLWNGAKLSKLIINGGTVTTAGVMHVWDLAGGVEMTGGTLQSNNGIDSGGDNRLEWRNAHVTTFASADAAKIAGRINLRADGGAGTGLNLTVADGAATVDLLISAAITEAGGQPVTKYGAGTLRLSGTNIFTGGFVIQSGTVSAAANSTRNGGYSSLGAGTVTIQNGATLVSDSEFSTGNEWMGGNVGKITVNAGGAWLINSRGNTVRNGLELSGGSISGAGGDADWGGLYLRNTTVTISGGVVSTIAADTAMNAVTTFTVASGSQLNFSGSSHNSYGATGGVSKEGDGPMIISGPASFTGTSTVLAGTLVYANTFAASAHTIASGAVLELNFAAYRDSGTTSFSGVGTLRKTGAGTIEWGAGAVTFSLGAGALIDIQEGVFTGGSCGNESWTTNLSDLNVATGAVFNGVEANVRVNRLSGTGTIKSGYAGAGYQAFTFGVDNGSGPFEGVLANATSAANIVKEGTGTIVFLGANTYSGTTQVSTGTLQVGDGGTIGALGTGAVTISAGATLEINRSNDFTSAIGQTFSGAGALVKTGSGSVIFRGNMSGLDNLVVFDGSVRTDSWNPWKDGLRLSVNGLGTFELWNTAVTIGELSGSGIIRNSANWSGYAGGAAIAVNNLTVQSGNFGGTITDNGYGNGGNTGGANSDTSLSLIKTGVGTLTLSGLSDYSGITVFAGGVVNAAFLADNGMPSSLGLGTGDTAGERIGLLFRGGVLKYTGSSAQTTNRAIRLSTAGGGGTIDASGSSVDATLVFSRSQMPNWWEAPGVRTLTLTGINTGENTLAAGINDLPGATTINVSKEGIGTWVLAGAGNYLGVTDIKAGTLLATHSAALGTGGLNGATMTWIRNGATLALRGDISMNEHMHVLGTGVGGLGAIRSSAGTNALTMTIGLDGDTTIGVDAGTLTLTNVVYGDGAANASNLTKVGAGVLVLSGANLYSGVTIFAGGVVQATTLADNGTASSLGVGTGDTNNDRIGLLFRGGVLKYAGSTAQSTDRAIRLSTDGGGGTIDASGSNPSATLSFTRASMPNWWENGGNRTLTLTGINSGENTLTAGINDLPGGTKINLTKSGVGTWVLAGAGNYLGVTNINAGMLLATNNTSLGVGGWDGGTMTNVLDGGTLALRGGISLDEHMHVWGAGVGGLGAIRSLSGNNALTIGGNNGTGFALRSNTVVGVDADTLTVTGFYEYGGSFDLTKVGAGTLVVTANSSYTGVTVFAGGVVNAATFANNGTASGLGAGTGDPGGDRIGLLFRGGVLQYTGSTAQSTDRAIRLSTDGGGGTIDASGSNPSATLSFTRASMPNWWENGGTRTLTLTGINTGENTLTAGIMDWPGVTTIHVNKDGVGTWVLAGASNYLGVTDIKAGTLIAAHSAALGTGGFNGGTMTIVRDGATLALKGNSSLSEHIRVGGAGVGGLGAIRNLAGANALTQSISLAGDTTIGVDMNTLTIASGFYGDGALSASSLTKVGNGVLVLSGSSIYTGATILEGGKLVVSSLGTGSGGSSLGDANPQLADKLQLKGAVTLEYAGGGESTDRSFTISGSGLTLSSVGTGPVIFTAASLVALSADGVSTRTITLTGTQTGDNTFGSTLLGNPTAADTFKKIIKQGVGKWVLEGSPNRLSTDFRVELKAGTLGLVAGALGGVDYSGEIAVLADSTLRWESGNADDLSSRISISDGVRATLDVVGGDLPLAASMRVGVAQTATLHKTGAGTLTLNASQAVSAVSMDAGRIRVNNPGALGSGAVTVNGGTLSIATGVSVTNAVHVYQGGVLEGTGGAGAVRIKVGGVLSPGASPGILTMQSLILEAGSLIDWQIYDAAGLSGVGYDRLDVLGAVDLSGLSAGSRATLRVISLVMVGPDVVGNPLNFDNNVGANTAPRSFTLATCGSLNLGTNQNINDAFTVDVSQFRFSDGSLADPGLWVVTYDASAGAVMLTAIPEPSTYGLTLGALALAVVAVRRRRERERAGDAAKRR
jgi:autotransporter-associated beta strand protein